MNPVVAKIRHIADSVANLVSGLGTAKDKNYFNTFSFIDPPKQQLDAAYRGDWIARKVVDIPVEDATRQWRSWQAEGSDIEDIEEVENSLNVRGKLSSAMKMARLYGGAILVMGLDGTGNPETPLDLERVKKDSLKFIHAVPRFAITPSQRVTDLMSPFFGLPEFYEAPSAVVVPGGTNSFGGNSSNRVHASRCVRLVGNEILDTALSADGWGDSVLTSVQEAILNAGIAGAGIAAVLNEMKLDIIKIPDFMENITTTEYTEKLKTRFTYANVAKSNINMLLLDKDEEWERIKADFAGTPDLLKLYLLIAAGAADIPVTRFLSQSATGLGATGEGDTRNYYDKVKSDQESKMTPAMATLDEVIVRSALGNKPDDVFYNWNSLWQLNDVEKADLAKKKAETYKIDVDTGLISDEALAKARQNQLIEDGTYPGLEKALEEAGNDGLDEPQPSPLDLIAAKNVAGIPANENAQQPPFAKKSGATIPPKKVATEKTKDGQPIFDSNEGLNDAQPRTLYVRRDVVNIAEFSAWAKKQGISLQDGLHVTLAFSRSPVDWMKVGSGWGMSESGQITTAPGGPRIVERLGDEGAVVLLFKNSELEWRHKEICEAGASWDYEEFQPHVTLFYDKEKKIDETKLEPFQGKIIFGPEIFEELKLEEA